MGAQVPIGDFSVMTGLSKKALRHYHDLGVLVPAHIDAHTGYRFYDTSQVDHAALIRRFRALDIPIPDIKALVSTEDTSARNAILTEHLRHMEHQLRETKDAVTALRRLLNPVPGPTPVVVRHEPATSVWSISSVIDIGDIRRWFTTTLHQLRDAIDLSGTPAHGPPGGLYERELFTEARGHATLFIPVPHTSHHPDTVQATVLAPAEVAVLTHPGSHDDLSRSYGLLGSYVHEHLISQHGPIREHYLGAPPSDLTAFSHTEICWPIFNTAPPAP